MMGHSYADGLSAPLAQEGAVTGAGYAMKSGALSSHGRILRWLQERPRDSRILDVGTAEGYVGQALRRMGFADLTGVERDAALAAAARAGGAYASVIGLDLERDPLPWPEGRFDVVVCADVLEHLREPAAALRRLVPLLAEGGWLVASIPNAAHWSMRAGLLFGRFDYADSGLLDRDHVRFFTRRSAAALLRAAGLAIAREAATPLPIAHWCTGSAADWVWRGVERLDWTLAGLRPSLCAYQFLFLTQRSGAQPPAAAP
jgi:SAM-dependent methyltransferase